MLGRGDQHVVISRVQGEYSLQASDTQSQGGQAGAAPPSRPGGRGKGGREGRGPQFKQADSSPGPTPTFSRPWPLPETPRSFPIAHGSPVTLGTPLAASCDLGDNERVPPTPPSMEAHEPRRLGNTHGSRALLACVSSFEGQRLCGSPAASDGCAGAASTPSSPPGAAHSRLPARPALRAGLPLGAARPG